MRSVVEGGEFNLLERLATVLCDGLWDEFDPMLVEVAVSKIAPPVSPLPIRRGARRGGAHLVNTPRRKAPEGGLSCGAAKQHRTIGIEGGAEGAPLGSRRGYAAERGAEGAVLRVSSGRCAFVSLGSNLGDRAAYLGAAREALAALPATTLVAEFAHLRQRGAPGHARTRTLSSIKCSAWRQALEPLDLLRECQRIEREHGRVRELRFGPRTLDIDILLFQDAESDDSPSSRSRTHAW